MAKPGQAREIHIDGQDLRVKNLHAHRSGKIGQGLARKARRNRDRAGLRRRNRPRLRFTRFTLCKAPSTTPSSIPFILVRPTGKPWNEAVNNQALRTLARFDKLYAKWFRAHPRIVDDKDLTAGDISKYHVVLFGDPGSNRWIAKVSAEAAHPLDPRKRRRLRARNTPQRRTSPR